MPIWSGLVLSRVHIVLFPEKVVKEPLSLYCAPLTLHMEENTLAEIRFRHQGSYIAQCGVKG